MTVAEPCARQRASARLDRTLCDPERIRRAARTRVSFTTRCVASRTSASASSRNGAKFRSTRAPAERARRAAAPIAGTGTSSCSSNTSSGRNSSASASASDTVPFAPGMTAMTFSPPASTRISATPVGPSAARTAERSTPPCLSRASASSANSSVPTAPTMRTAAPARAAASAWLAPLPPGAVENRVARHRLARPRKPLDSADQIEVDRAEDSNHVREFPSCSHGLVVAASLWKPSSV